MPCQPMPANRRIASSAAIPNAKGTLLYTMALQRFFFRGANSETIAPVVATRAPAPRPVTNRMMPKPVVDINAVTAMPTENHA